MSGGLIASRGEAIAVDRTCFYPGGGGQPPDAGEITLSNGDVVPVTTVKVEDGIVWHVTAASFPDSLVGSEVWLSVDRERRDVLTRYHTVLHILNSIALRDYKAWITGVQMMPDYARIDFNFEAVSNELRSDLEHKVNAVVLSGYPLRAHYVSEGEFQTREDLLRTLDVKPPIIDGRVRVVEIIGFDAQACGGTHARTTAEIGTFSIARIDNKGRQNKRLYVQLNRACCGVADDGLRTAAKKWLP